MQVAVIVFTWLETKTRTHTYMFDQFDVRSALLMYYSLPVEESDESLDGQKHFRNHAEVTAMHPGGCDLMQTFHGW